MAEPHAEGFSREGLELVQQSLRGRPDLGCSGDAEIVVLAGGEVVEADVHERGVDGKALVCRAEDIARRPGRGEREISVGGGR